MLVMWITIFFSSEFSVNFTNFFCLFPFWDGEKRHMQGLLGQMNFFRFFGDFFEELPFLEISRGPLMVTGPPLCSQVSNLLTLLTSRGLIHIG